MGMGIVDPGTAEIFDWKNRPVPGILAVDLRPGLGTGNRLRPNTRPNP